MSLFALENFLSTALSPSMFPHPNSILLEPDPKTPKKRAETWAHDETRTLVAFRREFDSLFNTSKSNKHLWDQISAKMREKGFERSPTMCTDKWRNLLKEFKKAKQQAKAAAAAGSGVSKMGCFREIEELLRMRNQNVGFKGSGNAAVGAGNEGIKVDAYMQFSEKGLDDVSSPFGSAEGGRSTPNIEGHLDHDRHPLAITAADAADNGVPPWNWRYTPPSGPDNQASYDGRVILVKMGEYSRKIRIDGTAEAIKEVIKSAFGLRTKRAFWLEDEDDVVCSLDRDMPLGTYTLHLDDGITIKVCVFNGTDHMPVRTEEKTFYTEDDFHDFLSRRGWNCLRELNGFPVVDSLDDLRPNAMYQGVRLLSE